MVSFSWSLYLHTIFLICGDCLIMACLQIHRELLSLATFLRVHSNSKQVSYLFWQNTYPNLKNTCLIKLNFFLWTKLLGNLLLAKYLISRCALSILSSWIEVFINLVVFKKWTFCCFSEKKCPEVLQNCPDMTLSGL